MNKAIVLLSGGMDSAVVAAIAKKTHDEVIALNILYGQVNDRERECAGQLSDHMGLTYVELDMRDAFKGFSSSLLQACGKEITDDGDTYVPARNSIFLSIAAGYADSVGAQMVYYGAHKDDAGGYPDTTVEYFNKMRLALEEGTKHNVYIEAPFINRTKDEIVKKGMMLNVPFQRTHSCYKNQCPPCGECPTCKLRAKAFKDAGFEDPLIQMYDETYWEE